MLTKVGVSAGWFSAGTELGTFMDTGVKMFLFLHDYKIL